MAVHKQNRGGANRFWIVCCWLIAFSRLVRGASLSGKYGKPQSPIMNEAIERLSKVFGISKVPVHKHHRSPPEYMVDLYKTVAYSNGITKSMNPFDADVVRGLPDRDTVHQMHFFFNVSFIQNNEDIIEAELRLFKLRPKPPGGPRRGTLHVHIIELRLYAVQDENNMYSPRGLRLLEFRRISAHKFGWEIFKVKDTIQRWLNNSDSNHGFYFTAQARTGEHVNGTYLRFAQRSEHHDSKQPVLVTYTEEKKYKYNNYVSPSESDILEDYALSKKRKAKKRRNFPSVLFLNEGHRAGKGLQRRQRPRAYNDRTIHKTRNTRTKRSLDYYKFPRSRKPTCARHELYVDFDEIGWSGWIISPKGYNAYHCKGDCPFPLGQNQKPTNHATVQSIVHALRIGKDVETPCCVPNKLYSISLLYFDDEENVILKQYDDMVAASCGCH